MAIPLTSRPTNVSVVIQCVMRTRAECRGESTRSRFPIASSSTDADSTIDGRDFTARLCLTADRHKDIDYGRSRPVTPSRRQYETLAVDDRPAPRRLRRASLQQRLGPDRVDHTV